MAKVQLRVKIMRDAKNPAACRQFILLKLEWIELIFSILGGVTRLLELHMHILWLKKGYISFARIATPFCENKSPFCERWTLWRWRP